jgi:hypothetical protein
MANTSTFYVSSKDNKIRRTTAPSREYFMRDGKKYGKAKYLIEVFGYCHESVAKDVRDMVDASGKSHMFFTIKVQMR